MKSILLKTLILVLTMLSILMVWYTSEYSMGVIEEREINWDYEKQLLLISQGSDYKENMVNLILDNLSKKKIDIKLIDVTNLKAINPSHYKLIVIIHTLEFGTAPSNIKDLISKFDNPENIFTVCTSRSGDIKIQSVDGISSASRIIDVNKDAQQVIDWVNKKIINQNN